MAQQKWTEGAGCALAVFFYGVHRLFIEHGF